MKYYLKFILVLFACWSMTSVAISQETLVEKTARADGLFAEKKWGEAESLYASIISNSPKDHDLNFRYGTCLLYGSKKMEDAIIRLRYSVSGQGIDTRAYYYLGRAYHLNYQFNDAVKQYSKFKQLATSNQLKDFNVEADIKACNYGKRLLANVTDMVVLEKTEIKLASFYELYDLEDIGGKLISTDVFQTKLDKKRGHRPMIHFPENSKFIYYSSYGDDGETGLDIYVKQQLPGGEWSLAQKVRGSVNTELDEAFAYMHPNGNYLYFCSQGHNSMGGFDVFRSRYNPGDQSFGPPENLDFAISSPDDDLLFVVDSLDRTAYFSSTRESGLGKTTVYKVRVDRIPMQMAVIKGNYLNTIDGAKKDIEIEVSDFSSGRIIGTYTSKSTNGDYLVTFPKSGKYNYIVREKDSEFEDGFTVEIPYSKELKPLKQRLTLVDSAGAEFMVIENLFNEEFDDPVSILAEVYREMSILPPNSENFNLDSLDALKETDAVFVAAGLDPFITDDGLKTVVEDVIEDLSFAKTEEEKQVNIAYNVAEEKSDLANEKMVKLNELLEQAENTTSPKEKDAILKNVLVEKAAIEELNNEAQSLIELAESIETSIADKEKKINDAKAVQEKVTALGDGDRAGLTAVVGENKSFFEANVKNNPTINSAVTTALKKGADEQKHVQELSAEISNFSKSKRELIAENKRLESQKELAKKQKDKDEIQRKIDANLSDIDMLESNISNKSKELDAVLKENQTVRNGVAAAIVLKDDYADSDYEKPLNKGEKDQILQKVKSNDLEESLTLVDEVLEKNNVSAFNIDLYATDEKRSGYSLSDWNKEIDEVAERLQAEKLKASESKQAQIQAEIDRLEEFRAEKQAEYTIVEDDPIEINPEVTQNDVLPDYTKRKAQLGEIVNEGDRRKAAVALNYELIEEIAAERKRLEKVLADNPKEKNVQERLKNLDILERDIKADVDKDEAWIAENGSESSFNKDELLTSLDPTYQSELDAAYEIIDEDERSNAIGDLNEIILQKSNERIQELEAIMTSDPDNTRNQEELEYLEELVANITENKNQPLVDPTPMNVDDITADVAVNDLVKDFENREDQLTEISDEYQRKEAENKLYNELVDAARSELVELDKLVDKNPANKTLKKRQEALRDLNKDYNKSINKNNDWLAENKPEAPVFVANEIVEKANPDYQNEINRIDQISDPVEKQKAIEALNESTRDQIDQRLDDLEALISQNPDNTAYFKERDELETLKKQLKSNKDKPLLPATEMTAVNTDPSTTDIMADYNEKLQEIEASGKSAVEQENAQIALNEDFLEALDAELDELNELLKDNPVDAVALNQRKEKLESLKDDVQDQIEVSRSKIENADVALNRPEVTVGTLMPSYEDDLAEISNSNKSEKDKLEEANELHKMLVAAIDYKIGQLEAEQAQNPDLSEAINDEIATLQAVKDAKKDTITSNENSIENTIADIEPENTDARPIVSVGALMKDYESQITDIKNGSGTDVEKMNRENDLHQALIDKADAKIADLIKEKNENPEDAVEIDADIAKLEDIKRSTQNSININKDQIAQLGGNQLDRPTITIGALIPGFEKRMADIENSKVSEEEKLAQKNELNNELLKSIESKIYDVQEEWEEDPNNGFTYNEELDKLEELKESKRNEIARNDDRIAELKGEGPDIAVVDDGAKVAKIANVKSSDYNAIEAQNAVAEFEKELNGIAGLNTELENLETELNTAESDNDKAKVQKNIDKLNLSKAKLENEVITGLEQANRAEAEEGLKALAEDRTITANATSSSENGFESDLAKADQNIIVAEEKMKQAKTLRNEAADEKNAIIANEKLTKAFQLESEATELITASKRIYRAGRVLNNNTESDVVITSVPENIADRKSTQKFDEAAELRAEANAFYDRAKALRDSSETVKKKNQAAILAEADGIEMKADQLNSEANAIEALAEELELQEEAFIESTIVTVETTLDDATTEEVATSELYENYYNEKNEGDEKLAAAAAIDAEIEEVKQSRVRRFRQGVDITKKDPQDIIDEDPAFKTDQDKIDSLLAVQKRLRDEALSNYENARSILSNETITAQENIMALEQNNVTPIERVVAVNADFEIPDNIDADIFRTTDVPVYSDLEPIPVDKKQPTGLVYKVQVGAFRNPLPQDHFKEFAPISGEQLNNGITRYMVGYFSTFDPANEAKTKVNGIGYGDAFVVAYCNGERITIDRAKLIEQGLIVCEGTETQDQNDTINIDNSNTADNSTNTENTNNANSNDNGNNTDNSNTTDNTNNTDGANNSDNTESSDNNDQSDAINTVATTPEERELVDYYTSVPNAAAANQVEIIKGLFFTVQIGVYSKPVPNSALFDIQPLNSQRTDGGFVRYSTGVFKSEAAAVQRRNEVVGIGIADAFVTAYFNGERITPEQALQILIRDGASALVGSDSNTEATVTETNNADITAPEKFNKEGLYYRILVGKYAEAIPGEYATLLLQGDGIFETEVDEDGNTCLISTKLATYEEMEDRLAEFSDLGIEDMDIVTYYKYDVIPFEEGEKIRNDYEITQLHPIDAIEGVSANTFIYNKEAVYFKIKLGEFEDKVPTDFTNLLLLYEAEENINKEETIDDETIFETGSINTYAEAEAAKKRLLEKGFDRAIIKAYHKYDEISVEKAKEILGE